MSDTVKLSQFLSLLQDTDNYKFILEDSHGNLQIDPPVEYYPDVEVVASYNARLFRYDIKGRVAEFRSTAPVVATVSADKSSVITLKKFLEISPMIDLNNDTKILLQSESNENDYEEVKYSESFDSYEVVKWMINPVLGYYSIFIK